MDIIKFLNRAEAAKKLAKLLGKFKGSNSVIMGIPRGGVITADVIAKELELPFGLLIVRKIGHPMSPEYAIAAISESGMTVKNEEEIQNIDLKWFQLESQKQLKEAKRRREKYWGKRESVILEGKTVIIVDDGLATGLTMAAAIKEAKLQKPKKIVVAVPVSPTDTAEKLSKEVDEFIAVSVPEFFEGAVADYYEEFIQVEDEEVVKIMKKHSDPIVFYMKKFENVAQEIVKIPNFTMGNYELTRFPNKEFQILINTEVKNQPTIFLGTIAPPHDQILEAFLTCHTLKKEGAKKVIAVFPYLAYMRHDRNNPKEDRAVDLIAKLSKVSGISQIITIDIHSQSSMDFFKIPIISLSPASLFAQKIRDLNFVTSMIVSPDKGATERAEALKQELNITDDVVVFTKKRQDRLNIISTVYQGKIEEKVIVVDDILDTGVTLINCVKILHKKGAKEILIAVTHGLFSTERWRELFNYGVTKIITTDSIPSVKNMTSDKIIIVPVSSLIIQKLTTTDEF